MSLISRCLTATFLYLPLLAAAQNSEEIRFKPNATMGTVNGDVSRHIKTYTFRAQKGQQLTATLAPVGGDKGQLTMTLYRYCGEEFGAPLADNVLQWKGELPCSDRYSIDVTPSADGMKEARVQRYALTLTIR